MKSGVFMTFPTSIKFFDPSSLLKELKILEGIERDENVTQKELARMINMAPSMINQYIGVMEEKGLLNRIYKSSKNVSYRISKKGIEWKNYLLMSYLFELIRHYNVAKQNIEKFFCNIEEKEIKTILLYGAGEVAETIITIKESRKDNKFDILAILDDSQEKQGKNILGCRIVSPTLINQYHADALVITSMTFEEIIKRRLEELNYSKQKIINIFEI